MNSSKTLKIEWRHGAAESAHISKILCELRVLLKKKNIDVILIEKTSKKDEILFNGLPMEFLLDEARVRENFCGTCSTLAERKKIYGKIPAALIKKAAFKAAGLL